ncbi:MAG: alpha-L-fucosidase [Candidatus Lokiarchaeota archaeon]|nr:alpha-L-fucosidase [Candidatus Lokiarchaeota archaeon]
MKYKATLESIQKHKVPEWFHDAKFGIFIHWGLYSVPAFAVTHRRFINSVESVDHYANNPYAEWYLNSLRITGSPTEKYHIKTYGKQFHYDEIVPIFNDAINSWDPIEWVELFNKVGAKYVVLGTKHHDGFLLWPSKYPNPRKKEFCANRDIVGELTKAVKEKGLKMGFYYSGSLDWSFNPNPITDTKSFLTNGNTTPEYVEYANNHWYELIDRYEPIILWNDIGYPPGVNLNEIFSYFYNKHPDGVINNRWIQIPEQVRKSLNTLSEDTLRDNIKQAMTPKEKGENGTSRFLHYDFITPEYTSINTIFKTKWETCRGIGNSFGYNQYETEDDYIKSEELIKMFVDIVSKNGNLLLNVGPMADGTIPKIQEKILREFGKWLEINGEAIYGTRPWIKAEGKTIDNNEIRYTQKNDEFFIHLLDKPKKNEIIIKSLKIDNETKIQLLGQDKNLDWNQVGENLQIIFPENFKDSPVYVLKLMPKPTS